MAEDTVDMEAAAALRCIRCIGPDPDPRTMRIAHLRHQRIIITTAMASASPQES